MDWPSLVGERALVKLLFDDRGPALFDEWLAAEVARIDDPAFARSFAEHVDLPGIVAGDFNHRHVRTSNGELLGGIRFYGRDVNRPFVEVVCHGFDDLDELCDCVRSEWSAFAPRHLRLHAMHGRFTRPGVVLDTSVYCARYRDMSPPDRRVSLEPFADIDEAIALVVARYERVAADDPELGRNISQASAEELRGWHAEGQLRAIRAGDETVGVLAIAPGAIRWLPGDEINEEVIAVDQRGHGYAAAAQCFWASSVAVDPGRLLIGTIDRHNVASRSTATRAGRRPILDAVFVSLGA